MRSCMLVLIIIGSSLLSTSCCGCPDSTEFSRKPLEEKIAALKSANDGNCMRGEGTEQWYLRQIAQHGEPAVVAMIPYLEREQSGFSPLLAMTVLLEAHTLGFDVSPAGRSLERLAHGGSNKEFRAMAKLVLTKIQTRERSPSAL